ncbi:hypothetical protein ACH5RR_022385 [Cinchona calisaya]|uniref:Terpene synthase metal-binding domain-containing protein n=1 Tax=Cinchona calisaya TaxID=153742 RepID=A0ABD2Z8N7_9GENT
MDFNQMLMNVYSVIANPMNKEAMDVVDTHDIVRWSSYLVRIADDLGTASGELERGDVPKRVQCYMKESGCSEEEAREHVWLLLRETWKKMNKASVSESPFSQTFVRAAKNFIRGIVETLSSSFAWMYLTMQSMQNV